MVAGEIAAGDSCTLSPRHSAPPAKPDWASFALIASMAVFGFASSARANWPNRSRKHGGFTKGFSRVDVLNAVLRMVADICRGQRRPHPRHWLVLAEIVSVATVEKTTRKLIQLGCALDSKQDAVRSRSRLADSAVPKPPSRLIRMSQVVNRSPKAETRGVSGVIIRQIPGRDRKSSR